ncbi:MAG: hypothetical protein RMJ87_08765 [Cytophagales bacterium]|nr:hypothetical protein [Cytophagales bacterium]
MRNIFSVIAVLFALLCTNLSAKDKKPTTSNNQPQTTKELAVSATVQALEEEFLTELQQYVYKTFELPARSVEKLNQLQQSVRVYDMAGNLVYQCKAGEYADLPTGAELITIYGGVAYYLVVK